MSDVPQKPEVLRPHESADDISHQKGEMRISDVPASVPEPTVQEVLAIFDRAMQLLPGANTTPAPQSGDESSADGHHVAPTKVAATADAMIQAVMNPPDPTVVDEEWAKLILREFDSTVQNVNFCLNLWKREVAKQN